MSNVLVNSAATALYLFLWGQQSLISGEVDHSGEKYGALDIAVVFGGRICCVSRKLVRYQNDKHATDGTDAVNTYLF